MVLTHAEKKLVEDMAARLKAGTSRREPLETCAKGGCYICAEALRLWKDRQGEVKVHTSLSPED